MLTSLGNIPIVAATAIFYDLSIEAGDRNIILARQRQDIRGEDHEKWKMGCTIQY